MFNCRSSKSEAKDKSEDTMKSFNAKAALLVKIIFIFVTLRRNFKLLYFN